VPIQQDVKNALKMIWDHSTAIAEKLTCFSWHHPQSMVEEHDFGKKDCGVVGGVASDAWAVVGVMTREKGISADPDEPSRPTELAWPFDIELGNSMGLVLILNLIAVAWFVGMFCFDNWCYC
jgi:hypothetical protein